jgi:hypothetical protein
MVYTPHRVEERGEGVCALLTISLGMFDISNIPRDIVNLKTSLQGKEILKSTLFCNNYLLPYNFNGTPTKRQVSKRQVSKRLVSKRLVSKRQVYKTSGLQNVRLQNVRFQNIWFQNVHRDKSFKTSGF